MEPPRRGEPRWAPAVRVLPGRGPARACRPCPQPVAWITLNCAVRLRKSPERSPCCATGSGRCADSSLGEGFLALHSTPETGRRPGRVWGGSRFLTSLICPRMSIDLVPPSWPEAELFSVENLSFLSSSISFKALSCFFTPAFFLFFVSKIVCEISNSCLSSGTFLSSPVLLGVVGSVGVFRLDLN